MKRIAAALCAIALVFSMLLCAVPAFAAEDSAEQPLVIGVAACKVSVSSTGCCEYNDTACGKICGLPEDTVLTEQYVFSECPLAYQLYTNGTDTYEIYRFVVVLENDSVGLYTKIVYNASGEKPYVENGIPVDDTVAEDEIQTAVQFAEMLIGEQPLVLGGYTEEYNRILE